MQEIPAATRLVPASEIARYFQTGSAEVDNYLGVDIYANTDPEYLRLARERLAETARAHAANTSDAPSALYRAPGRLGAFLEYLDMCAGDHMSTTIDGDMPVCVSPREDGLVRVFNTDPEYKPGVIDIRAELEAFASVSWTGPACDGLEDNWDNRTRVYPYHGHAKGEWLNYIRGAVLRTAWELGASGLRGMDITFGPSSIPPRGGTSSSSAVVVLSFLALRQANLDRFPDWDIKYVCGMLGEAEWYVGTHGGANDHMTILRNAVNGIVYNRHSLSPPDSTPLPGLRGVRMVLANSLWEAAKALNANYTFNLRKGWMDLGDDLMRLAIGELNRTLEREAPAGDRWIHRATTENLGLNVDAQLPLLSCGVDLWRTIARNYNRFGSLDSGILGVSDEVIDELVHLLPEVISPETAAGILGKDLGAIERDYTVPTPGENGYRPRGAAAFFHKENRLGRELERLFLEADRRLRAGELTQDSREYDEYRIRVGAILEEIQDALREDFHVSNSQLDMLLDISREGPGYLGAKLTGAGCGGCVVVMVREGREREFCSYLDERYYLVDSNFDAYRARIASLEPAMRAELSANLESALGSVEKQRRAVTFSRGACALEIGGRLASSKRGVLGGSAKI